LETESELDLQLVSQSSKITRDKGIREDI